MDQLLSVQLALPEVKPHATFPTHTTLLSGSHAFRSYVPLMFVAPGVELADDLGHLFADVPPNEGTVTLELGLVLPDTLPDVDNLSDCVLQVKGPCDDMRTLCLSNRMSRFHFFESGESWHSLTARTTDNRASAEVRRGEGKSVPAIEEVLATVAAMRFQIAGETAEEAFRENIRAAVNKFLTCVNRILEAARATSRQFRPITRSLTWDSVSTIYILVSSGDKTRTQLLGLSGGRLILRPGTLENEAADRFRQISAGTQELSDVDRMLDEARSSFQSGEYEFAFLQAVIAAEIETGRTVRTECLRRGVSKARLDDSRRDLTYAWALNIGLPLAFDESVRPPATLVAEMNSARRRRNALMHEAEFGMSGDQVCLLVESTGEYVKALRAASARVEEPTTSDG